MCDEIRYDGSRFFWTTHQLSIEKKVKNLESIVDEIFPSYPKSDGKLDEENYDLGKLLSIEHQYMLEARIEKLECIFRYFHMITHK